MSENEEDVFGMKIQHQRLKTPRTENSSPQRTNQEVREKETILEENKLKSDENRCIVEREQQTNETIKKKTDNTDTTKFYNCETRDCQINIWLLNIRGVTTSKITELTSILKKYSNNIICLTETHEKFAKINVPDGYYQVAKRRRSTDKKGGGLMILFDERMKCDFEEMEVENPDILSVKVTSGGSDIIMILIYMDVKDIDRNMDLQRKLNKTIEENENNKKIILGDFNAHTGYIGSQERNRNGRYLDDLIGKFNLIMLNLDDRCKGTTTREENGIKSTIDFVLICQKLYKNYLSMEIDEEKNYFDMSDHCILRTILSNEEKKNKLKDQPKYYEYISVKDELKANFIQNLERKIEEESEIEDMEEFEKLISGAVVERLQRKILRKETIDGRPDPIWFTKEIKEEIKLRRFYNRKMRNAGTETERRNIEQQYVQQRSKVKHMVREAIETYEKQITNEIKGNGGQLWNNINKLRGQHGTRKRVCIHDGNGVEMEEGTAMEDIKEYWSGIYHKQENNISEEWNSAKREEYKKELTSRKKVRVEFDVLVPQELREAYNFVTRVMEREGNKYNDKYKTDENEVRHMNVPLELVEHYEMVGLNNLRTEMRFEMEEVYFTTREVQKQLQNLKSKKTPGPNSMKPEIYKWMADSNVCLELFTHCVNKLMRDGRPPTDWKKSSTILIPKKEKPTSKELRPLALTNITYKIFMSLIKERIFKHLERNDMISEYQAGFTKGRRIEENLMILRYCMVDSKRKGKPLYVAAIDYAKAFDSVKRESIIFALRKYKCEPRIIEIIANLYTEDTTTLILNEEKVGEMTVKSGIRQGCTVSPLLFIMVLNHIIDEIVSTKAGFRNDAVYVPVLFFADDGMLLSQSQEELERMLKTLVRASGEVGLRINREKCNIMIFNKKDKPETIQGINTAEEFKYLGITINDTMNCYRKHKEKKIKMAHRMANMTYSVIARSCNKMIIGKTYWKSVVLPALLYGTAVLDWTDSELEELQKIENQVWRSILNAPVYTPCAVLRGEMGASCMQSRVMKTKLKFINWSMKSRGGLLKEIVREMIEEGDDRMILKTMEKMRIINIASCSELERMTPMEINRTVNEYDESQWKRELELKSTISIYRNEKTSIREEKIYENDEASTILFRARSNTLQLEWRQRFTDGDVKCKICNEGEEETLLHFVEKCVALQDTRERHGMNNKKIEEVLLFSGTLDARKSKAFLLDAWKKRKRIMKSMDE